MAYFRLESAQERSRSNSLVFAKPEMIGIAQMRKLRLWPAVWLLLLGPLTSVLLGCLEQLPTPAQTSSATVVAAVPNLSPDPMATLSLTPTPVTVQAAVPRQQVSLEPIKGRTIGGFLLKIPDAERECIVGNIGMETLSGLEGGRNPTRQELSTLYGCLSGNTMLRIYMGDFDLPTNGVSPETLACLSGRSEDIHPPELLVMPTRGCRQKSLLQIITARSWQMAKYDAVLLA